MENKQLHMPIRARPYDHQRRAFSFTCQMFGLAGHDPPSSRGVALLMEMGTGKSLTTIAVAARLFRGFKFIQRLWKSHTDSSIAFLRITIVEKSRIHEVRRNRHAPAEKDEARIHPRVMNVLIDAPRVGRADEHAGAWRFIVSEKER